MSWKQTVIAIIVGLLIVLLLTAINSRLRKNHPIQKIKESEFYHVTIMDPNTVMLNSRTHPYDTIILKMDAYKMIGEYLIQVEQ